VCIGEMFDCGVQSRESLSGDGDMRCENSKFAVPVKSRAQFRLFFFKTLDAR